MAKKTKTEKKTNAKAKAKRPEQLKIAGTQRTDSIPEIEEADAEYRDARDAWMNSMRT